MSDGLEIAFFGSSLVSSWWNGACTYYRGLLRALAALGHEITFFEPLAYSRQEHRDIPDPDYATVVFYRAEHVDDVRATVEAAATADVVVKTSGVGVFDDVLECEVARVGGPRTVRVFWDVDAPATLARVEADPADAFRSLLPSFDLVLTYGGGDAVVARYRSLGARECAVVYNALDPTTHYRVEGDDRYRADCALLANRLPDREKRIEEFFFEPASLLPEHRFLLAGNGWEDKVMPPNTRFIGHLGTKEHNAFNSSPTFVLNVTRDSMASHGWSPATRIFEAAGAGACLITDQWQGIEEFLLPGEEILVARDAGEVAAHVASVAPSRARVIGERAASRVLLRHTYSERAAQVDRLLRAHAGAAR
jgi:spore maturation protein CgeB